MARKPITFDFKAATDGMARGVQAGISGLKRLTGALQETDRAADRLDGKNIDIDVNERGLTALRTRLETMRAEITRDLEIDPEVDTFQAIRDIRRIDREIKRLDQTVDVNVDLDRNGITRTLSRLGPMMADGLSASLATGFRAASQNPYTGAAIAAAIVAAIGTAAPAIALGVGAAVTGGITAAMATVGRGLLEATAELDAADRKFKTVFRSQTAAVEEWARAISNRAGVGVQGLKSQASAVQDLLVPRGFKRGEAAEITKSIVERGIALAEFSGKDKAFGIESVTKALLGEREQLKSLGVQIRQSDLNDWLKQNADVVDRVGQGQAEVIGTLEILESRSKDAWDAYLKGGADSEQMLDSMRAQLENLKNDAILGFGRIFVQVLRDIKRETDLGINFDDGGLAKWIDRNSDQIRTAFIEFASLAVNSGLAFVAFARGLASLVSPAIDAAQATLQVAEALTYTSQAAAGPLNAIPAVRQMFTDLRNGINSSQDGLGDFERGWDQAYPGIVTGLNSVESGLTGLGDAVNKVRGNNRLRIEIKTALAEGDLATARQLLKGLTKKELKELVVDLKGSDKEVDKRLRELARKRIAQIEVVPETDTASRVLQQLTKREIKDIIVNVKDQNGNPIKLPGVNSQGGVPFGVDSSTLPQLQPQIVVQMNDGRLADYIGIEAAGQRATVQRTYVRRYGVVS